MKSANPGFSFLMALFAFCSGIAILSANGCIGTDPGPEPIVVPSASPIPSPFVSHSPEPLENNKMLVTVNGSLCGPRAQQYANEPCVSVRLCSADGTNCQTIDNILLDTGSYGLRLYRSVITVPLEPVTVTGGLLAECVGFGDNSSEWGQVEYAYVGLASESPVRVPIMVIDSTYSNPPRPCTVAQSRPDTGPAQTGFNGILGVGLHTADCGDNCANYAGNEQYYVCTATHCAPSAASLEKQVSNPVSFLSRDNNGVILDLPTVVAAAAALGRADDAGTNDSAHLSDGAIAMEGTLYLGIGTQPNNQVSPKDVTTFGANGDAEFQTVFASYDPNLKITSFIDSGSSALFFPAAAPLRSTSLPDCSTPAGGTFADYVGFYCPAAPLSLSAVNYSETSNVSGPAAFGVSNSVALFNSGNYVFATLADDGTVGSSTVFDWGLPFFYGKKVYVGISGAQSPLATGPYWAY